MYLCAIYNIFYLNEESVDLCKYLFEYLRNCVDYKKNIYKY